MAEATPTSHAGLPQPIILTPPDIRHCLHATVETIPDEACYRVWALLQELLTLTTPHLAILGLPVLFYACP